MDILAWYLACVEHELIFLGKQNTDYSLNQNLTKVLKILSEITFAVFYKLLYVFIEALTNFVIFNIFSHDSGGFFYVDWLENLCLLLQSLLQRMNGHLHVGREEKEV